jgi:hypothetical protein
MITADAVNLLLENGASVNIRTTTFFYQIIVKNIKGSMLLRFLNLMQLKIEILPENYCVKKMAKVLPQLYQQLPMVKLKYLHLFFYLSKIL